MLGGTTYEEGRAIALLNQRLANEQVGGPGGTRILLGGSTVHNSARSAHCFVLSSRAAFWTWLQRQQSISLHPYMLPLPMPLRQPHFPRLAPHQTPTARPSISEQAATSSRSAALQAQVYIVPDRTASSARLYRWGAFPDKSTRRPRGFEAGRRGCGGMSDRGWKTEYRGAPRQRQADKTRSMGALRARRVFPQLEGLSAPRVLVSR